MEAIKEENINLTIPQNNQLFGLEILFKKIENFDKLEKVDLKDFKKKLIVSDYIEKLVKDPSASKKKIAKSLGISPDTINKYAKSLGVLSTVKTKTNINKKNEQIEDKKDESIKN